MTDKPQTFWSSMPGILTGMAAIITALTGLYLAVNGNSTSQPTPTPPVVTTTTAPPQSEPPSTTSETGTDTSPTTPALEHRPAITTAPAVSAQLHILNKKPFPTTGPLVDCSRFPTVNTVTSLMSWSKHYHQKIIAADGSKRAATDPCNKTIDYRGMAHCKTPDDVAIRKALLDTLTLCRAAGIEWQNIKHSTIIGKE